jgi:L-rhamnose mutarotase
LTPAELTLNMEWIGGLRQSRQKRRGSMKRYAFKMKLKPGCEAEHKKRHDELWPELGELIRRSGISDYSIFLDEETSILFAVQKQAGSASSQDLGSTEVVQRWWKFMADIMETNPDNSPVSIPLIEVFRLD